MTVRVTSKDPGHDALRLLARWIADAYLEELASERTKELSEINSSESKEDKGHGD
jgi:hypothetical protein